MPLEYGGACQWRLAKHCSNEHTRWIHAVAFFNGRIIAAGGHERESVECFTLPNAELPLGQWVLIRPMSPPTELAGLHPFGDALLFVGMH